MKKIADLYFYEKLADLYFSNIYLYLNEQDPQKVLS